MTRLLLDTHVFLWLHTDPDRLGPAKAVMERASTKLFLSAASSWEIAIKWKLGKLPLPEAPETYVPSRMRIAQVESLPITHTHALGVASLPDHHRDPFDRMLVAQARTESLTLVTVDPLIQPYDVRLMFLGA